MNLCNKIKDCLIKLQEYKVDLEMMKIIIYMINHYSEIELQLIFMQMSKPYQMKMMMMKLNLK